MKPRTSIGVAKAPDGSRLELVEHDGDYMLMADSLVLMTTRNRRSEEVLARQACEGLGSGARVLIGGLGMGFTLRSALSALPADSSVVQAELMPEIVDWNRGPLGDRAERPLEDPRVELVVGDVGELIRARAELFDAIILDVDNGPSALVTRENSRLYSARGLFAAHEALKPGGRLAIWSADGDPRFLERLESAGFTASAFRVKGRDASGGPQHVVFHGRRD